MSDRDAKSDMIGTPRKPSRSRKEPVAEPLAPECPPELGPIARAEWFRIVPYLAAKIELTPLDRGPLAIYCVSYERWLEGIEALQKYGTMMKTPKGFPVQSPYVSIVNREADVMMRIASEYGFTPASRAKVFPRKAIEWGLLEPL